MITRCISILVIFYQYLLISNAQKVPVMIWNTGGIMPKSLETNSLVDDVYPEDIMLDLYPNSQLPKVVFVQDNIDVEQFSNANLPYIADLFDNNNAVCKNYYRYNYHL